MAQFHGDLEVDEPLGPGSAAPAFPADYYDAPAHPAEERANPRPPAVEVVLDGPLLPSLAEPSPPLAEPESLQISTAVGVSSRKPEHPAEAELSSDAVAERTPARSEEVVVSGTPRRGPLGMYPAISALAALGLLGLGIGIGRWIDDRRNPAPSRAIETDQLRPAFEALSARLDDMGRRVEALPAPPDLAPLQARVEALAKSAETAALIQSQIEALERRFADSARSTETLGTRVAESARSIEGLGARLDGLDKVTALLRNECKAIGELRLSRGVDLFKAGQYAAARDAFARLRESQPDDARLWYYSALANGFATNRWDGETERLALQGVERERAHKAETAEIDAAFADLPPNGGRNWLAQYRSRVTDR